MSGTAAKEIRRDLRRAFGPEALEVIDSQGAAMEALAKKQAIQDKQIAFLTKELKDIKEFRESIGAAFRGMR